MIGILKKKFGYGQIIVFGYMFIILFGGLLLSLPVSSKTGEWTSYLNSVFTATSATCVTGLVVYDTYTHWSVFGQIIIMILIQIGGLGFMTIIALFSLFLKKNIGLYERKLLMQSAGSIKIGGVIRLIRRVALGTLIVEGTGMILLATSFVPKMGWAEGLFNALFHSVSAFCNAGFDIMGKYGQFSSITGFQNDVVVNVTIMVLIVVGGIGFIVWNDVITQKWHFKKYQLHSKIALVATIILIFGGAILFLLYENNAAFADLNIGEKIMAAFFQSITPRTAGFNSVEMSELSESGHLLTIILMFIGGSPGSTAGGIKTTTFVVVLLGAIASARHYTHINAFKKRLDESIVKEASAITTLYIVMIMISTLVICSIQPFSMKDVLFEVVSAIGTVGLTAGITTSLGSISKIIIILLMFAGRVGGLTLALVLAEKKTNVILDRPVEKILIG